MHRGHSFSARPLSKRNLDFHSGVVESSNWNASRHSKHGWQTEPCDHSREFHRRQSVDQGRRRNFDGKTCKSNKVLELKGSWIDIHNRSMSFNARRFHKIEPHTGHMWALAAYTPKSFRRCSKEVIASLESLEFPLPQAEPQSFAKLRTMDRRKARETPIDTESSLRNAV